MTFSRYHSKIWAICCSVWLPNVDWFYHLVSGVSSMLLSWSAYPPVTLSSLRDSEGNEEAWYCWWESGLISCFKFFVKFQQWESYEIFSCQCHITFYTSHIDLPNYREILDLRWASLTWHKFLLYVENKYDIRILCASNEVHGQVFTL